MKQPNHPRRLMTIAATLLITVAGATGGFIYLSLRMPEDSPMAKMYRTEAGLAALGRAVEAYRYTYGVYPPEGLEGLEMAVTALSRRAKYFPDGPPRDGWGRVFVYAPGGAGEGATRLFSLGEDGETGQDASAEESADDIQHGRPARAWRAVYEERQRSYMSSGQDR